MSRRTTPPRHRTPIARPPKPGPEPAGDDPWSAQMTALLRDAAEARADRERARTLEDARSTRTEVAALQAMIAGSRATDAR